MAVFFVSLPLFAEETVTPINAPTNTNASEAPTTTPISSVDISDLELKIRDQRSKIEDLERQQKIYETTIAKKEQEALSLENQITILDTQISSTEVEIQKQEYTLEAIALEIAELNTEIAAKNLAVQKQKVRLAELLRAVRRYQDRTPLEIWLLNDTFSEFYQEMKTLQTVEGKANEELTTLKALKADLERQQDEKETKKTETEDHQRQLGIERQNLSAQQDNREGILKDTKKSEAQFELLLEKAKQEQLAANADIQNLEVEIRKRLEGTNQLPASSGGLVWPIESRRITATFHDPEYIFRRYFEHPAIDIATPQGTPIRAAASGIVGRARDAGLGYSYIMLLHANDQSTVYGHVSQISIAEGAYVVQGQVIGATGGTPGTRGAGRLTTGPHLHFEVRSKGIPVDPMGYLP